jgi:glycerol-1-phosphate dehydrogenase [NAD(P)+]
LNVNFDPKAREFFEGIQERLIEAAPRVVRGDPEAAALVLEALLLSGFSMVIAGSSAPASGGEHLISHYLDMKSALYGTRHDLHGAQVGVATVYCLGLWERILALEAADIDPEKLADAARPDDEVRAAVLSDWGPEVGVEVQAQWDAKKMDRAGLRHHLERVRASLPRMKRELPADLLPAMTVARAIRDSGGPTHPDELDAPLDEYHKAQQRSRYIRNRFTVLDLAGDLGLLECASL